MSSVQALRDFINERLTAAAGEIFTVFEQTMVQYEEEIVRQRRLLEIRWKPQIKFHRTEQHIHNRKTSSSLEQEEHEAPHIKEEEDVVEVTVTDGESDDSHDSVRDLTTQRLTAAAGEIFTMFEQTVVQYKEEIVRQRRLLEIIWTPQLKLHRTEVQQRHDCGEEQLCNQETKYCQEPPQIKEEHEETEPPQIKQEQEETEPPQIKEEQEETEPSRIKEEQEETEPPQIKEEQEETEPPQFKEEKEDPEPPPIKQEQEEPEELKKICIFHSDRVENFNVSEKQAECEEACETTVCKKPQLCQNLGTLTDNKMTTCEICGKTFNRHHALMVHMRTHTGEKPFCCNRCRKRFNVQSNLLRHMRTHTGEKPFSCDRCRKRFNVQSNLLRHMRMHTGERPFPCETCGQSFSQQYNLLAHMRTHTGEKPYSCETCGKSFSLKSKLYGHMRNHTEEKPHCFYILPDQVSPVGIAGSLFQWSPGPDGSSTKLQLHLTNIQT